MPVSYADRVWRKRDFEQDKRNEERAASWAVRCRVVPQFQRPLLAHRIWSWEGRVVSKPQKRGKK
jgi:hypothetical protein